MIIAIAFGFFVYSLLNCFSDNSKKIKMMWLHKFSFSLYLIHYPLINTVYYCVLKFGFKSLQPNIISLLVEILLILTICVIAYSFSKITEAKTNHARKFLLNILESKPKRNNKIQDKKKLLGS